ncbi:MAG TPA: LptF/LptG family permease [Anaeromyxobacteraceae bacterium]|nr:LptF/LptG family permease [Anaeromyxobacteraceae bacterium]
MILFRYVATRALLAFLAALAGVMAVFLVVDFVDNAHVIQGAGWLPAALELYANKAAEVAVQIAPAAVLLGAALATSGLRQTREWTAFRAVGLGPWRLAVPVIATALLIGAAMVLLQDLVGVQAAQRAEEISATRFTRGGSYRRWLAWRQPKRWFRGADGRHIYHLRGTLPGGGFEQVTVFEVTPDFHLARRIDAVRMTPSEGGAWRLEEVEERTFAPDGTTAMTRAAVREERFDEPPGSFDLAPGRPSQLRYAVLSHQIEVRHRLGQASTDFELERANRIAYQFAAVPGALLAVALALRRGRRGHVSSALLEAVGVSLALWGAQGFCLALGLSGRLPPLAAAWIPNAVFLALGGLAVRRAS